MSPPPSEPPASVRHKLLHTLLVRAYPSTARSTAAANSCAHARVHMHTRQTPALPVPARPSRATAYNSNQRRRTWPGTVAPPVIIDGDLTISQSYAQNIYIGRKAGLETGTYCQVRCGAPFS